jgi:hypothetical protein
LINDTILSPDNENTKSFYGSHLHLQSRVHFRFAFLHLPNETYIFLYACITSLASGLKNVVQMSDSLLSSFHPHIDVDPLSAFETCVLWSRSWLAMHFAFIIAQRQSWLWKFFTYSVILVRTHIFWHFSHHFVGLVH